MNEVTTSSVSDSKDERIQKLYEKREELALVRDILMLQLEIVELQNQKKTDNGNTNTEESETGKSVSNG